MSPEQRQQLAAILHTFDEAGLVALSNRGLVRRSRKDLEAAGALSIEETASELRITGPGWVVLMPPGGPVQATDDTPATGITRQILTATLWLQSHWLDVSQNTSAASDEESGKASVSRTVPIEDSLLGEVVEQLTWNQLSRWAGSTLLREAASLLPQPEQVSIKQRAVWRVQFPEHDVEVRFVPPAASSRGSAVTLLDAALSTAPQAFHRRWVVLAVLSVRRALGVPLASPEESSTAKNAGLPRSCEELLASVQRLLATMVEVGLSRPSEMLLQRLFTLSVSCVGAHLPRLARELRGIAAEVQWLLDRHARSHSSRLLHRVARTAALTTAIQRSGDAIPLALAGRHRTQYDQLGTLRGVGCGAFPLQAAAGMTGVQLVLWDRDRQRFWTWSTSRPTATGSVSAESLYASESVWNGGVSPGMLSRSVFEATRVQANDQGRLSTSQKTELVQSRLVATGGEQDQDWNYQPADFGNRGFTDWGTLRDAIRQRSPVGLQESDPTEKLVAVFPHQWGTRRFLDLQQRLSWSLLDEREQLVDLSVPWTTLNEQTLECVESLDPERDRLRGVIGMVERRGGDLTLFPVAFLSAGTERQDRVINPAFDRERLREKSLPSPLPSIGHHGIPRAAMPDVDEDMGDRPDGNELPHSIAQRLREVDNLLLRLAESSNLSRRVDLSPEIQAVAQRTGEVGLAELASALGALLKAIDREDSGDAAALALLHAVFVNRLYREVA